MNKQEIIDLGASDEVADKIIEKIKESYITKSRFNEVNEAKKNAESTIETMKKNAEMSDLRNKELETAKVDMGKVIEQKDATIKEMRINHAVADALRSAGAKNLKTVLPLLDITNAEVGDDGKIKGLEEQINALKESEESSFLFSNGKKDTIIKGATPANSDTPESGVSKEQFSKMSYSERLDLYKNDPDAYKELSAN